MKLGFIGSGKVGQSFGLFMKSKNIELSGYYNLNPESAIQAAERTQSMAFMSLADLVTNSDMIGITVNDDQIEQIIDDLLNLKINSSKSFDLSQKWFFHMSGVHDICALKRLSPTVFGLHPLKAFTQVVENPEILSSIYYGFEAENEAVREWVNTLNLNILSLNSHQKIKYHLSAVLVSNYLVSLINLGIEQLVSIGIDEDHAEKALLPLIQDTIHNVQSVGHKNALTGPVVRGDVQTIKNHMSQLDSKTRLIYQELGAYTVSLTQHDENMRQQLLKLFKEVKDV